MRTHDAAESAGLAHRATRLVCALFLGASLACAGGESEEPMESEPAAAEDHAAMDMEMEEGSGAPRIWFISPEDGATVSSPVRLEFGHENFTLEPKGPIHEGAGHHHVGVDTDCLPPGELIPEAAPWVHLGDASAQMEMQLPPGEHTLTIQIGDGEHRTLDEPGLCQTITVTVEGEEAS